MKPLVRSLVRSVARSVLTVAPGPAEPEEFITNGTFDADTNWVKGAGWSIGSGVATNVGNTNLISQDFSAVGSLTNGNSYTLAFTLVNANGGLVRATLTGGTGSQTFDTSSAGAISHNVTATDARTTLSVRSVEGEPISIDAVSLRPA